MTTDYDARWLEWRSRRVESSRHSPTMAPGNNKLTHTAWGYRPDSRRRNSPSDDYGGGGGGFSRHTPDGTPTTVATSLGATLPRWSRLGLRILFGATATLYVLNQKHLLPKHLSGFVSKTLFWPTLPITVSRRIGKWTTDIDDAVVIGGAPLGFIGMPERLHDDRGVRGVINMCDEYRGPTKQYDRLGMNELWLRTVDHFEPSVSDLKKAVKFIEKTREEGGRVYVHCRAGHGRSAAAVFAWLIYKDPDREDLEPLNEWLSSKRNVRKTLWKQPNIKKFQSWAISRNQKENLHRGTRQGKHEDTCKGGDGCVNSVATETSSSTYGE